jgi:hypothetical protein
MNDRNTVGEAIFVRDTKSYEAPKDDDPVPGSLVMSDAMPKRLVLGAQDAQALPNPAPGAPAPRPPSQVIRSNVPQWNRPPPGKSRPVGKTPGRLGRLGMSIDIFSCITARITSRGPSGLESRMSLTQALADFTSLCSWRRSFREISDGEHHQPYMTAAHHANM